jgi:hypothetical protein
VSREERRQAGLGGDREPVKEGLILENCLFRITGNPKIF